MHDGVKKEECPSSDGTNYNNDSYLFAEFNHKYTFLFWSPFSCTLYRLDVKIVAFNSGKLCLCNIYILQIKCANWVVMNTKLADIYSHLIGRCDQFMEIYHWKLILWCDNKSTGYSNCFGWKYSLFIIGGILDVTSAGS